MEEEIRNLIFKVLDFNKKDTKTLLDNIIILVDTREQKNQHITEYFDKHKIKYINKKLDYGDYSFMIQANNSIDKDLYFNKMICIERKKDIDELANNMGKDRPRIKSEFAHMKMLDIRNYIFIEDYLFDKNIREGNYRSNYTPKALYGSLKALEQNYNTIIRPIKKEYAGSEIYNTFRYYLLSIIN